MTDHPEPVLLAKWLAHRLSSAEQAAFAEWVAADAARATYLAELRELWDRTGQLAERRAADGAAAEEVRWNAILRVINEHDNGVARPRRRAIDFAPVRRAPSRRRWLATAAAAMLVAGAGMLARRSTPWASMAGTLARPGGVAATAYGERRPVTLRDGTRVVLAPGSTLRWASDYGRRERLVELNGEAAFVVTHDADRPFRVRTSHASVRDLGTRFDVRAYPGDVTTEVVVAEGTVAIVPSSSGAHPAPAGAASPAVLHRGDRAVVAAEGGVTLDHDVPLDRFFAWTSGRLVMYDLPVREVVARLNRWYGIEIRYPAGVLDQRTLRLSLEDESAAEAVQIVANVLDLRVSQAGNIYTLHAQ